VEIVRDPEPPVVQPEIRIPAPVKLEDNKPFVKLANETADFMNELDALSAKVDENSSKLIGHTLMRMQEYMERCGVARIDEESVYDVIRHRSASGQHIAQGAPISEMIAPGLILGNKVLRRAKVK
jgi:molecular chaperone GrpE (heat shock protein)